MAGWKRFSNWVVALTLVSGAAWAGTPVRTGTCFKSDGSGGCDGTDICDYTGVLSACGGADGQNCSCYSGVECVTDGECRTDKPICDTTSWTCAANSDGSGGDGSGTDGTGFGCSSTGASLLAILPLVGLLRRRNLRQAKA